MKKSKISEAQIIAAIKEYEAGKTAGDICRGLGVHQATFYNWKKKYSGMDSQELRRLKEIEEENRRLKLDIPIKMAPEDLCKLTPQS